MSTNSRRGHAISDFPESRSQLAVIRAILDEDGSAKRWQNPAIELCEDGDAQVWIHRDFTEP